MVILLATAFVGATIVIHATATWDALGAVIVSHVGLGANDGLDALLLALFVELDNAIHVAVVGNAKSRLTIFNCFFYESIEARCTVEHGVLGVDV